MSSFVLLLFVSALTLVFCDLSDYIGIGVSTAYQSSPIDPSIVATHANSINGHIFRLFELDLSPAIAESIVSQSTSSEDIQFIVPFWDVNNVTASNIDRALNKFSSVRSNVAWMTFGNEPDLSYWPPFDTLAPKLELIYQHLNASTQWNHVKVCIPFSGAVFGNGSHFQTQWQSDLTQILRVLQAYDGPFTLNLYPVYDLIYGQGGYTEERLQYALGAQPGKHYNNMLEELYDRGVQAIYNSIGENHIELMLTETGWPTRSDLYDFASVANAKEYVGNVLAAMSDSQSVLYEQKILFFELFDEDTKGGTDSDPALMEKHWGVYDTNASLKYYVPGLLKEASNGAGHSGWQVSLIEAVVIAAVCVVVMVVCGGCVYWVCRKRRKAEKSAEIVLKEQLL